MNKAKVSDTLLKKEDMSERALNISQQRQAVSTYVETMASVITRESNLSPVIEAAIAHNILDPDAQIDNILIETWFAAIFPESHSENS